MASSKDYVVKQAERAAQTYRPAPVYKPYVPYQIKEAGTASYTTTSRNIQTQRQSGSGKAGKS